MTDLTEEPMVTDLKGFRPGERVLVPEFRGTVVSEHDTSTGIAYTTIQTTSHKFNIPSSFVEREYPENWPPQIGDIWSAKGDEYYVRESVNVLFSGIPVVEPFSTANGEEYSLESFHRLRPVLIRRRPL
jgi:hypothetical protein